MKKRILSILIVVIMVCSLAPTTAWAESRITVSTEAELREAVEDLNTNGGEKTIVLSDNITIENEIDISKGTLTLHGDGHTLKVYDIVLKNNASLNLGKSDGSDNLVLTSNNTTEPIITAASDSSCVVNMYTGTTIKDSDSAGTVGGVLLSGTSTFNMHGGLINNCNGLYATSGAVLITESSTFNFYDGKISNCSGMNGGAVGISDSNAMWGEDVELHFNMYDGKIVDCTDNWFGGGAVCIYSNAKVDVNILGGEISGCSGTNYGYGGAVFCYAQNEESNLQIKDVVIKNNSAKYGGGVFIYKGTTTIADNAAIYNNIAEKQGADIFNNGADVTLGAVASGLILSGCKHPIDGWYVDGIYETELDRWDCEDVETHSLYTNVGKSDTKEYGLKAAHSTYTVTYTDGVENEEVFADQIYGNLPYGSSTPDFAGVSEREGYNFAGWNPDVSEIVEKSVVYVAQWEEEPEPESLEPVEPVEPESESGLPKNPDDQAQSVELIKLDSKETKSNTGTDTTDPQTGDNSYIGLWIALMAAGIATGVAVVYRRRSSDK